MQCLIDFIGIRGCGNTVPPSGLYLNELAGISIESIAKLSKPEQDTYLSVWADVQKRAVRKFNSRVIAYFSTKTKLKRVMDNAIIGVDGTNNSILPMINSYRGFGFVLAENNPIDSQKPSPLVAITLSNLDFYSTVAATLSFSIGNTDGLGTYQFTKACVVGWNRLFDTYTIPYHEVDSLIGVVVDASTLTTFETIIPSVDGYGCSCTLGGCCSVKIVGIEVDNGNIIRDFNAHGFRCNIALGCSYDGIVCVNKDLFSTALWYLMGAEMMAERMFSDRINRWTTIDRKKAEELHAYYLDAFQEELALVIDGIDLADNGCCLECDPLVSFKWTQL
jgi:hypothetical protein